LQSRIIASQFDYPFDTRAAQNIDDLLVIALLAIAAAHALHILLGTTMTSPVLLVLGAGIVTHFFIAGRFKLHLDWLALNQPGNLALSGSVAGWLGGESAGWARWLSSVIEGSEGLLGASVLTLELGGIFALLHFKVLRWWLAAAIVFHLATFAIVGFWFASWIALELSLIVILSLPSLRSWVIENMTAARAVLSSLIVIVGGAQLFHPPALAWLDSPVAYGYRVEAVGESGTRYHVPISSFAPVVQELTFARLGLGETSPASGGYGAVSSIAKYEQLTQIRSLSQLEEIETPLDLELKQKSELFMIAYVDAANERGSSWWHAISPPDHFWTTTMEPQFRFEERIEKLDVHRLTALHSSGGSQLHWDTVLSLTVDDSGKAQIDRS
jgi:hypothetical protein